MRKPTFDPGLTEQFTAPLRRVVNKDGSFNVHRRGETWRASSLSAPDQSGLAEFPGGAVRRLPGGQYGIRRGVLFAGTGPLLGGDAPTGGGRFLTAFSSARTRSARWVWQHLAQRHWGRDVGVFRSIAGVLGFAVATGLLFGRVSRPSANIGFSESMVIAPYQDGVSLQFRVVNRRPIR